MSVTAALSPLDAEALEIRREMAKLKRTLDNIGRPLTLEEKKTVTLHSADLRQRLADHLVRRMIEHRPEVISHGKPASAEAAKRGLAEARARLERNKGARTATSECPAATAFREPGGSGRAAGGVRCGVERSVLTVRDAPQSLLSFCFGDHSACPTWRAEKERLAAARPELVTDAEGV